MHHFLTFFQPYLLVMTLSKKSFQYLMPTAYCAPPPFKRNEWIVRYKKVKHNRFTASQHDVFKETENKTKQNKTNKRKSIYANVHSILKIMNKHLNLRVKLEGSDHIHLF